MKRHAFQEVITVGDIISLVEVQVLFFNLESSSWKLYHLKVKDPVSLWY